MSDTEHDLQPIMNAVMEAEEEQPVVQLTRKGRVKKPVSEAKKKHLENARALRKPLYDKSKEALKKLESLTARGIDIEDLIGATRRPNFSVSPRIAELSLAPI